MTNEEKALEIQHNDPCCVWNNGCPNVRNGAMEMAQWKQKQIISQMKEFIAEYFYEHPHSSWLICSDEFQDLDDCFERLERYLKEED